MKTTVYCDYCGAPISRPRSKIYDHNFCCLEHKHRWQCQHQVEVTCDYCGAPITRRRSNAEAATATSPGPTSRTP